MIEQATVAGGCFWCAEAVIKRLKGIQSVTSGYSGGTVQDPTYDQVSAGITGHAEAIQIDFDPAVIPYEKILIVFFATHNPTELNKQGNDVGTQYRSEIFYHSDIQKKVAENVIKEVENQGRYKDPIVTKITPFTNFYTAEPHHQSYYERNQDAPYCQFVINPKIQKLMKEFRKDLKDPNAQIETS